MTFQSVASGVGWSTRGPWGEGGFKVKVGERTDQARTGAEGLSGTLSFTVTNPWFDVSG